MAEGYIEKGELDLFEPVGLDEICNLKLMDRVDKKYLFPVSLLHEFLPQLSLDYKILKIGCNRVSLYKTVYIDTPGMFFFNQHVTGKLERYKVRYRKYETTGTTFLEVKRKDNKGRTIKWRIEKEFMENGLDNESELFVKEFVPHSTEGLIPVLSNSFYRIMLLGFETGERISIDFDLSFSDPSLNSVSLPFLAIAEVKRERGKGESPISTMFKDNLVRPSGFSKYCVGNAILHNIPKRGIVKPKLLTLKRIENEYNKYVAS